MSKNRISEVSIGQVEKRKLKDTEKELSEK